MSKDQIHQTLPSQIDKPTDSIANIQSRDMNHDQDPPRYLSQPPPSEDGGVESRMRNISSNNHQTPPPRVSRYSDYYPYTPPSRRRHRGNGLNWIRDYGRDPWYGGIEYHPTPPSAWFGENGYGPGSRDNYYHPPLYHSSWYRDSVYGPGRYNDSDNDFGSRDRSYRQTLPTQDPRYRDNDHENDDSHGGQYDDNGADNRWNNNGGQESAGSVDGPPGKPQVSDGANPKLSDAQTNQALVNAVKQGDGAAVKQLLESGADLEVEDKFGRTPLWLAAQSGQLDMVRLLLEHGADRFAMDINGETIFDWGLKTPEYALIEILTSF